MNSHGKDEFSFGNMNLHHKDDDSTIWLIFTKLIKFHHIDQFITMLNSYRNDEFLTLMNIDHSDDFYQNINLIESQLRLSLA